MQFGLIFRLMMRGAQRPAAGSNGDPKAESKLIILLEKSGRGGQSGQLNRFLKAHVTP